MTVHAIASMSADASILIAHFSQLPKGTVVTYEEMKVLIGWDIRENRSVFNGTVSKRLRKDHDRVVGPVMGVGYKVLTNKEVADGELRRDRERRRRAAIKSKSKAQTVDMADLNEADRITLLAEVTTAHIVAEASKDKSVKQITGSLNGATQPLALNNALDAIKRNLTK